MLKPPFIIPNVGISYSDLSQDEKDRYNADIRATNIILKMLLEGSELTKEDRESQLYDDFEHFRAAGYGGAQNRVGNANPGQARQVKCYNCNGRPHSKELHSTQAPKLLNTSKTRLVADASSRDGVVLIRAVNYTKYMKPPRECRDDVKPSYIVGSHADYTRNSNNEIHRIQYVKGPTHYRYTKAKSVYGVQISDLDLSA
ncbi:hypothetical protein Tco_0531831 [Tanacetum coccineum]